MVRQDSMLVMPIFIDYLIFVLVFIPSFVVYVPLNMFPPSLVVVTVSSKSIVALAAVTTSPLWGYGIQMGGGGGGDRKTRRWLSEMIPWVANVTLCDVDVALDRFIVEIWMRFTQ
ncbi:unnamed protein product [Cuscuta europaea]|uniref:Uncharacterized protein n=1 Tax=Cuscuta europaea TaxID=41803 RepID=A0A9P1EL04_CUSEU|nr:unnamed protein product [Cuscuta europaea]